VERRLGWHRELVAVTCSIRCSDKGRSLHHMSPRTYPFAAEPAAVREVYPWTVAIGERPVAVVAEQLCGLVVEELRRRGM
jgi:hypothetical protein